VLHEWLSGVILHCAFDDVDIIFWWPIGASYSLKLYVIANEIEFVPVDYTRYETKLHSSSRETASCTDLRAIARKNKGHRNLESGGKAA
jgi:hypothetical protein